MQGWTDNYIRLSRPYDASRVGTIEQVTITSSNLTNYSPLLPGEG